MPPAKPPLRDDRLLYAALALLVAVALVYRVRDTIDRYQELRRGQQLAELPFDVDLPQFTIAAVFPPA